MDAKVLRAAVSAAIRVTVSTSLVACGNTVSGDARPSAGGGASSSAASGRDAGSGGTLGGGATGQAGAGLSTAGTGLDMDAAGLSNGGSPSSSTGGQTSAPEVGGAAQGGIAQASGGSEAEAGAPAQACGADLDDCLNTLGAVEPGAALDELATACCVTVRATLIELKGVGAECYLDLARRFQAAPARQACCKDPSTWEETACAPWGPPVPPELPCGLLHGWVALA